MRTALYLVLTSLYCTTLLGYTHTIKLDNVMKNKTGTYEIILDGRPETSFTLIVGRDQQISTANKRGVDITITPQGELKLTNTTPMAACLLKLTINDTSKKLMSNSIETKPFRTSASGPSYCGDYTLVITIEGQRLKINDKTVINR